MGTLISMLAKLVSLPFLIVFTLFSNWFGGQQEMRVTPDLHVEAQINYGLAVVWEGSVKQPDGAELEEYFEQSGQAPVNVGTNERVSLYTDEVEDIWPAFRGGVEFFCWKVENGTQEESNAPDPVKFSFSNRRSGTFSTAFNAPEEQGCYLYLAVAEFNRGTVGYIFELNVNDLYSDGSGGQDGGGNGIEPPQVPDVPADFDRAQVLENGWTVLEQDGTFYGKEVLDQFVADVQNEVAGRRELVMVWAMGESQKPIVQVVTYQGGGLRCDSRSGPAYTYETIEVEEDSSGYTYFYRDYDGQRYLMLHINENSVGELPFPAEEMPNVGELTPEQIDVTGVVIARQDNLLGVSGTTQDGNAVELVLDIARALVKDMDNRICSTEEIGIGDRICVVLDGANVSSELLQGNARYIYLLD